MIHMGNGIGYTVPGDVLEQNQYCDFRANIQKLPSNNGFWALVIRDIFFQLIAGGSI